MAFHPSFWRNNGTISIIEMSNGDLQCFPLKSFTLKELSSGKRNDILSIQDQKDLERIELEAFGEAADTLKFILNIITTKNGFHVFFRKNGVLVGYCTSIPANKFCLHMVHPEFDYSYNNLYMYSIAGITDFMKVTSIIIAAAKKHSYQKLITHVVTPRFARIHERYGFRTKLTIKEWIPGFNAEYMESYVPDITR